MQTGRRALLRGVGVGAAAGVAGCTGVQQWFDRDATLPAAEAGQALTAQYDAANSGHHPETTAPRGDLEANWEHSAEVGRSRYGTRYTTQPVVRDGTVFYAGTERFIGGTTLFALDADTGEEQWRFDANIGADSTPAIVEDRLVVPLSRGVFGLDTADATPLWSAPVENPRTPTVVGDRVVFTTSTGALHALDVEDGTELWTVDEPDGEVRTDDGSTRGIDRGSFVSATADRLLHRYRGRPVEVVSRDPSTGDVQWRVEVQLPAPPVPHGDRLYGLSWDGILWAFDASTGDRERLGQAPWGSWRLAAQPNGLAVGADSLFVAGVEADDHGSGVLAAFDLDGRRRWSVPLGRVERTSTPIVADGTVFATGSPEEGASKLVAATTDGDVLLDRAVDGVLSAPTVLDGTLYSGLDVESTTEVRLRALREP